MLTPEKLRGFGVLIAAITVAACAGSSPSASVSSPPHGSPGAVIARTVLTATPSDTAASGSPRLVALAKDGTSTLWALDDAKWSNVADLGDATGIAPAKDGVAVAQGGDIRFMRAGNLSSEDRLLKLSWPGGTTPHAAAFAVADDGEVAFALTDEKGASYAVADPDGHVSALDIATSQPFSPLVGWVDASRQLILVTDAQQVSRLGVRTGSKVETLTAIGGCRWFAVSGDRSTVAMVTESGVYADSASSMLGNQSPPRVDQIDAAEVVWSLALSRDGQHLALLHARVGEDGKPTDIRETVYSHNGAAWTKDLDIVAPSTNVLGQAWVG